MTEKEQHTKPSAAAKSRVRSKTLRPTFELNIPQTEMAKTLVPEAYGATSLNTLAKKLFLEFIEKNG